MEGSRPARVTHLTDFFVQAPGRRRFVAAATAELAAPLLPGFARAEDAEPVIVVTDNGKLRGMRQNGGVSFKDVPYAADTGGKNRFLAPQPVASWTGVRDALQYGDRCPQLEGGRPLLLAAAALANGKRAPVYVYNFTWKIPADDGMWGAPHAVDIPFAFGNVEQTRANMSGSGPSPDEVARNLMSAFIAFARTGNPNNPRLPQWKPYDAADRAAMTINEKCLLVDDYLGADRRANLQLGQQPTYRLTGGPLFRYSE